ncbi:hypothetical protein [Chryseobacterium sp. CH1]|uniref:hypothetical protein n=1 Tax=Chryseobacterium sp. CH1 TaxID=713551 RepID=UPI00100A6BFD|nr:hypothetical protein [Chryseobacterium sp. CH1]RXM51291.1 hypothetical protein BOQ64_14590 [Chryseobacterium sp. CH25]RXM64900.1 hypothetical protein BOQ60_11975 [Chryseobacterium sp. CH1]
MILKIALLFTGTILAFWISAICGGGASLILIPTSLISFIAIKTICSQRLKLNNVRLENAKPQSHFDSCYIFLRRKDFIFDKIYFFLSQIMLITQI